MYEYAALQCVRNPQSRKGIRPEKVIFPQSNLLKGIKMFKQTVKQASMIDNRAIQQAKRRAFWQGMLKAARGVIESRKESPYNFSEI